MKMKSTKELISIYGDPLKNQDAFEAKYMTFWEVPNDISEAIPILPKRIYCHKLLVNPLERTFNRLIDKGLHFEIKTFDGCYNPRYIRGSKTIPSRHAWGLAIDMNAAWNKLGQSEPSWSEDFIEAWRDENWTFGGNWLARPDPMHFQWDNF
jgi:hypothetical protein